jgi:hypothetical protein
MTSLNLVDLASVAQVAISIFTVVGVISSLYFSIRALREVQMDRRQKQRPHLSFVSGGYRYPITFVKAGKRIPGVDPKSVERYFPDLSEDAESVRLKSEKNSDDTIEPILVGRLTNYGLGPALEINVTWVAQEVKIGGEKFKIDDSKRQEAAYKSEFNTMPSMTSHLMAEQETGLTRLPTLVEKDVEKKLQRVDGYLLIKCSDVFGTSHEFKQSFHLFTGYEFDNSWCHITFSKLLLRQVGDL